MIARGRWTGEQTCNGAVDDGAVFEFDGDCLVGELHEEPDELHGGRVCGIDGLEGEGQEEWMVMMMCYS